MSDDLEKSVYNLLWVWKQYNSWGSGERGFSHACMGAGENATDFLTRLGYGHDDGYCFVPNQKALDLMDDNTMDED